MKHIKEHSEAKVSLYSRYFSIYLNVLARTYIKNIYLFDLFCGEGIYEDGGKGSPIAALECIRNHYFNNNKSCPNLFLAFNDLENSKIEPEKLKIDRVKVYADQIFRPDNVKVAYTQIDYSIIIEKVIIRTNELKNDERALVFIDPYGYKNINPEDIKKLIANSKTEVLLFLPIYFMSRFAEKAKDQDFKGGEALRNFLGQLFGSIDRMPSYTNQAEFIYLIQEEFKTYLKLNFVDSYKIERDNNQWFALYFFTTNPKGYLKMLESKWSLDVKHGSGFKQGDGLMLDFFNEIELTQYDKKVLEYLKNNPGATNKDLQNFGLCNNFLPKHTKQVLDEIRKTHEIEIIALDGKKASGYYLSDDKRIVNIKLKELYGNNKN
ncbi:MAG: three-Cys-motif partner protein TcmP [Ignavibacteriales bacterium]|nr:three-Cys-motif partner protein TcmP [Ignavibacteriales bacterium]